MGGHENSKLCRSPKGKRVRTGHVRSSQQGVAYLEILPKHAGDATSFHAWADRPAWLPLVTLVGLAQFHPVRDAALSNAPQSSSKRPNTTNVKLGMLLQISLCK